MRRLKSLIAISAVCLLVITSCVTTTPATDTPPVPTATVTPGGVVIQTFYALETEAAPGDKVTLRWITDSPFGVEIAKRLPDDTNGAIISDLPSSGETTVTLDEGDANKVTFILTAITGGDPKTAEVEVKVTCTREWFFQGAPAEGCPLWPADQNAGQGAAQQFEHGQVIFSGGDGWAIVLYNDPEGGWTRLYPDWKPGDPETGPALLPPDGLVYPAHQIRAVWNSEVIPGQPPRLRLGWATAPEVALATNYQCDSDFFYVENHEGSPCFVTGPEGVIYRLWADLTENRSKWEPQPGS